MLELFQTIIGIDSEESRETLYKLAERKLEAGDQKAALRLFNEAGDYSDASQRANEIMERMLKAGDIFIYGHYEQDNLFSNGKEPIEWLVLARDGDKVLLLSRYGLDAKPFNDKLESVTWEECTLRTWLNETFMNEAFTEEEKGRILLTNVNNSSSQGYWSTRGGNKTLDKIFLLSYAEANKYLGVTPEDKDNMKSRTSPTAYAIQEGAWTNDSKKTADGAAAGWWRLRSPGYYLNYAALVDYDGSLRNNHVRTDGGCVRPALWIDLESLDY